MDQSRQHGNPVLLTGDSKQPVRSLTPVPLGSPAFSEGHLQHLLAEHPEILPIDELEPAFGPLIFLGREISTESGFLDLLYTSPDGYLTLVETKLWSNPESKRKVVGQILDYAKDFAEWQYEDLAEAVVKAERGPRNLLDPVRESYPDVDQSAFIDGVTRNLMQGRVLLLVVGDGIRSGVESMTDYLQQNPSLRFSLALIELAMYRLEAGKERPLLLQPRTVVRTAEVPRAVVEVRVPDGMQVEITVPEESEDEGAEGRTTLTETAYFEELEENVGSEIAEDVWDLIEALRDLGAVRSWGSSSVSMRYPDPAETGKEFTIVVFRTSGEFYLGWLDHVETKGGYDFSIAQRYLQGVGQFEGVEGQADKTKPAPVQFLLENEETFLGLVERFMTELDKAAAERV